MKQLDAFDLDSLFARRDFLNGRVPRCPECDADQVQIMDEVNPALWRCRECKHYFAFEPGDRDDK